MKRALLVLLLVGCGDPLVTGSFTPPYFTIDARTTTAPSLTSLPKTINMALMWMRDAGGGPNYATEVVTLSAARFPIDWQVAVRSLPPPAALVQEFGLPGVDPTMRYAKATLVAYADNNGNGQLDIDPMDGTSSPDVVLGAAPELDLFYLAQGHPAPPTLLDIVPTQPGFSLVQAAPLVDPDFGQCDLLTDNGVVTSLCYPIPDGQPMAIALPATIDFVLTGDPSLQRYACASFWGPEDHPDWDLATKDQICDGGKCPFCEGTNCPLDIPPPGVTVECSPDGLYYRYKKCSDDPTRCGTTFCHFGHGARLPNAPVPAGWPCPTS